MAKCTASMNTAVKCITMTVCSGVFYCGYYVVSPAINLSLLISNKSDLWWASQTLEIWSLQHHTCREDSSIWVFLPFFPLSLCSEELRFNPGHTQHTLHPLVLNRSLSVPERLVLSYLALTKILGLKARLVLQFGKCFPLTIFGCHLSQIRS